MKKFTTLCLSLLLSATTFAQTEPGTFSLQPKVGINVSNVISSDGDNGAKAGLVFGAEANYQLNKLFSFSIGTIYSQQGTKQSINGADVTMKLDYINVPILINFHVVKGLALKVGVQPGFLINDKAIVERNGVSVEFGIEKLIQNTPQYSNVKLQNFDFSIPIGVSYEFSNVMLDARYCPGLVKIFSGVPSSDRHSVFQFTLGYKFDL